MILTVKQAEQFRRQAEQRCKNYFELSIKTDYTADDVKRYLNRLLVNEGFYSVENGNGISVVNSDNSVTLITYENDIWNVERRTQHERF